MPSLGHWGDTEAEIAHGTGVSCVRSVWYYEECRGVRFWMFGYFTVKPLSRNAIQAIGKTGLKFE